MEVRTEVKVFQTNKKCDKCQEGNMIFNGNSYRAAYTSYSHTCDKCKSFGEFKVKYPILEYESIN